jgi:hypothetical protein
MNVLTIIRFDQLASKKTRLMNVIINDMVSDSTLQ